MVLMAENAAAVAALFGSALTNVGAAMGSMMIAVMPQMLFGGLFGKLFRFYIFHNTLWLFLVSYVFCSVLFSPYSLLFNSSCELPSDMVPMVQLSFVFEVCIIFVRFLFIWRLR